MWHVTLEITQRIGNDSGYLSLQPPSTTPHPIKPNRLIFLETEGWSMVEPKTKEIFGQFLENCGTNQITIIKRNLTQ